MKEYIDRTGRQLIIVAVECSHDPDNGRLKEYSPFPFTAPNTAIYMDYGANEINFHAVMRKQFRKVTDLLLSRDVLLTSRIVPEGSHWPPSPFSHGILIFFHGSFHVDRLY